MKNIRLITNWSINYEVRNETYNGKDYIVVPVVMMVEGVHSGSHGPILHTIAELGKYPPSWNGIPVTIYHPRDKEEDISANSPDTLTEWAVGQIFNTHVDGLKLRAEAWLELEALSQKSPETLQKLNNKEPIEVSLGIFSDEEEQTGEWNGEQYTAIAHNHRPDHLALLPGAVGACSVGDGCGIRNNKKGGNIEVQLNEQNRFQVLKDLNKLGYQVGLVSNSVGMQQFVERMWSTINAMDTDDISYYLEEVFEGYLIYRKRDRTQDSADYFRQTYQVNADDSIELTGDPQKVKKRVEYDVVSQTNVMRTKFSNNSNTPIMERKCTPCVLERVNSLIANTATKFAESDREWLEALSETQLDVIMPVVVTPAAPVAPAVNTQAPVAPTISSAQALEALKEGFKTMEDYLQLLPAPAREVVASGIKLHAEKKTGMITTILANTAEGVWTEDRLKAMDMTLLESIHKSIAVNKDTEEHFFDFSLNGGETRLQANASDPKVIPMAPTGIVFKEQA